MPSSGTTGKHYAQVVFQIAQETNAMDTWQADLDALASLASQRELVEILKNPRFPFEAKRRVLEEALQGSSPEAVNLASLLVSQGRFDATAPLLAKEFGKLVDGSKGILQAEVTTATPVDESQRLDISQKLAQATGKTIKMQTRVQPAILGGMVVRLGDQIIDGSVRRNLDGLRRSLAEGEGIKAR